MLTKPTIVNALEEIPMPKEAIQLQVSSDAAPNDPVTIAARKADTKRLALHDELTQEEKALFILIAYSQDSIPKLFSEIERLMASGNVNINAKDANGKTVLHHAALKEHFDLGNDIIYVLLDKFKADPNLTDNEEKTPLYCAAFEAINRDTRKIGSIDAVETLIKHDTRIDELTKQQAGYYVKKPVTLENHNKNYPDITDPSNIADFVQKLDVTTITQDIKSGVGLPFFPKYQEPEAYIESFILSQARKQGEKLLTEASISKGNQPAVPAL